MPQNDENVDFSRKKHSDCSSGHAECSFEISAKKISNFSDFVHSRPENENLFAESQKMTKKNKKKQEKRKTSF